MEGLVFVLYPRPDGLLAWATRGTLLMFRNSTLLCSAETHAGFCCLAERRDAPSGASSDKRWATCGDRESSRNSNDSLV